MLSLVSLWGIEKEFRGEGDYKQLEVRTQGLSSIDDFLILELGSDVIMGLQWRELLGEITTNWKEQLMRFY